MLSNVPLWFSSRRTSSHGTTAIDFSSSWLTCFIFLCRHKKEKKKDKERERDRKTDKDSREDREPSSNKKKKNKDKDKEREREREREREKKSDGEKGDIKVGSVGCHAVMLFLECVKTLASSNRSPEITMKKSKVTTARRSGRTGSTQTPRCCLSPPKATARPGLTRRRSTEPTTTTWTSAIRWSVPGRPNSSSEM